MRKSRACMGLLYGSGFRLNVDSYGTIFMDSVVAFSMGNKKGGDEVK